MHHDLLYRGLTRLPIADPNVPWTSRGFSPAPLPHQLSRGTAPTPRFTVEGKFDGHTLSQVLSRIVKRWYSLANTWRCQRLAVGREQRTQGPAVLGQACGHRQRALPPSGT